MNSCAPDAAEERNTVNANRFDGRTAVVTGAASGIGAAIAAALIAEGANVVGLDFDEAGLRKQAAELGSPSSRRSPT